MLARDRAPRQVPAFVWLQQRRRFGKPMIMLDEEDRPIQALSEYAMSPGVQLPCVNVPLRVLLRHIARFWPEFIFAAKEFFPTYVDLSQVYSRGKPLLYSFMLHSGECLVDLQTATRRRTYACAKTAPYIWRQPRESQTANPHQPAPARTTLPVARSPELPTSPARPRKLC